MLPPAITPFPTPVSGPLEQWARTEATSPTTRADLLRTVSLSARRRGKRRLRILLVRLARRRRRRRRLG